MPTSFSSATAEQVVSAVEAVVVNRKGTTTEFVADFSDLPRDQAQAALELACNLQLLSKASGKYETDSFLCRFFVTANQMQKASVMRIVLESFDPFVVFRERLMSTGNASNAAQQTKVALNLDAHKEAIKDTLISLGTYSHALVTEGGGRYRQEDEPAQNILETVAKGCRDAVAAEQRIREQFGSEVLSNVSRDEVIVPLADGLLRAGANDPRGAVVSGGNAVESFLDGLAAVLGVSLTGATGINGKLEKFQTAQKLPRKLIQVGKYLGNVRNAADHGIDSEIGAAWTIRSSTGIEFIYVACSFIASAVARSKGKPPEI